MPLLAGRTVMITVARVDDRTLRVNVIPTKKNEDENAALTTPLSYTGTPEELDRELGQQLAGYVDAHQRLGSTLAQANGRDGRSRQGRAGRSKAQGSRAEQETAGQQVGDA